MARSTKRTWTVTFKNADTDEDYSFTGPKASAILQSLDSYERTGLPKLLLIVDPDTGARTYINMKCICNFNATVAVEDVEPRPCLDICCIPDRLPAGQPEVIEV